MAILTVRTFGDPVLRERCAELEVIDERSTRLVRDLLDTMYHYNGLGLAANQVGVVERLFVFDLGEGPVACFNPEVVEESSDLVEEEEGCLSLPGVSVPVSRPAVVELGFTDIEGKRRRLRGEGLMARLFRHEMDHLDGGLLLERASRENRIRALKMLDGELPD